MARDPHDPTSDEYYTKYESIQEEVNYYYDANPDVFRDKTILCPCDDPDWSNFTKFFASSNFSHYGLKALICTSYAYGQHEVTEETKAAPQYDEEKEKTHGKLYILTREMLQDGDTPDTIPWQYLEGDGDYASDEVTKLCSEADVIITNPPFSQFVTREDNKPSFIKWCVDSGKQFLVIGELRKSYKVGMYPYLEENKCWVGVTAVKKFYTPEGTEKSFGNIVWYTNIEHMKHIKPMEGLHTTQENIETNRSFLKEMIKIRDNLKAIPKDGDLTPEEWIAAKEWLKHNGYYSYFNCDAIEVPIASAIPSDYPGIMGVSPSMLMNGLCPEQFEIVGTSTTIEKNMIHTVVGDEIQFIKDGVTVWSTPYSVPERKMGNSLRIKKNGVPDNAPFARFMIRYTDTWKASHPELFGHKEI